MSSLDSLQPAPVWRIFEKMSAVPRGSGNEAAVLGMFKGWADRRGLPWKQDEVGNLLVCIPASPGRESAPVVLVTVAANSFQIFCTEAISTFSSGVCAPRMFVPNVTMSMSGYFSVC